MGFQFKNSLIEQSTMNDKIHENCKIELKLKKEDIMSGCKRLHAIYDKNKDMHYDSISALHKSIRGSDENASIYWLGRMLEGGENPLYIARRLIRIASEDIGLADPNALHQAVSTHQACHVVGNNIKIILIRNCS